MRLGRLNELDEHPAGVLGVQEVDPRISGADARLVIQNPHTRGTQLIGQCIDIGDPVGQLLQARSLGVQKLADGEDACSGDIS